MGPLSQGAKVTTRFHLLQRLRMSGAIPLFYIHAFMTCTGSALHFNSMSVCDLSKFHWCHKWLAIGRRLQSVYVMLEMNLVNELEIQHHIRILWRQHSYMQILRLNIWVLMLTIYLVINNSILTNTCLNVECRDYKHESSCKSISNLNVMFAVNREYK